MNWSPFSGALNKPGSLIRQDAPDGGETDTAVGGVQDVGGVQGEGGAGGDPGRTGDVTARCQAWRATDADQRLEEAGRRGKWPGCSPARGEPPTTDIGAGWRSCARCPPDHVTGALLALGAPRCWRPPLVRRLPSPSLDADCMAVCMVARWSLIASRARSASWRSTASTMALCWSLCSP